MVSRYARDILNGKYKIPISWLHRQAYCEYQIYLEHVAEFKVEKSPAMIRGIEKHKELDDAHFAIATPMSLEEALEKATAEHKVLVYRDFKVEGKNLVGRIDELHIEPKRILIIDDKPTKRQVYNSDIRQVWGYCLAYEEENGTDRPLFGSIRDRDSQRFIWQEQYTESARKEVKEAVQRIFGILSGEREAQPTKKYQKCRPCRFKNVCDKALVK